MKVTVVGLGFVGKPLLEACVDAGYEVRGVDIDDHKLDEIVNSNLAAMVRVSNNLRDFTDSDVFVLALPTPIDPDRRSDLSQIRSICTLLATMLTETKLVVIESTYPPGTTRNIIIPLLKSDHKTNRVLVCYSPERLNPGDSDWNLSNTPKLYACEDPEAKKIAEEFYGKFIEQLIYVDNFEVAETAKLLENMYRYVNINFINEFQKNCESLGIDTLKVIEAASSKPFGFQKFLPSLGVGGHCIPIAPYHFLDTLKPVNTTNGFLEQGNLVNQSQASSVISKVEKHFSLKDKNVLVVGITYKAGVPDVRESPVLGIIENLKLRGSKVKWFDFWVQECNGEKSVNLDDIYDFVLICVKQPDFIITEVVRKNDVVIDISNGLNFRRLK